MHIDNAYRNYNDTFALLRECFALEKIHGTSAHISYKNGAVTFFSGGEKHANFVKLFDAESLQKYFAEIARAPDDEITIYGEAYGGKQQKQSWRYGNQLKFVAFDVKVNEYWLDVPTAHALVEKMGLEFVHYKRVSTDIPSLDAERDAPSEQAKRNGVEGDQPREGVVLRPIREWSDNGKHRIISKHKRAEERETKTQREIDDPEKTKVLQEAVAIATEWVTHTRLEHVLDKMIAEKQCQPEMTWTPEFIKRMVEDVVREGSGEFVDSPDARKAMSAIAANMFKKHVMSLLGQ